MAEIYTFEPGMFTTKTHSVIGRNYNRTPVLPYIPDVLKATRDPLLTRKGLLVYGEMGRDDMVDLGLSLLCSTLVPTVRVIPGQDTADAKWIADIISSQLDAIPGGIVRKIHKIMKAFLFGFSMTEQCFGLVTEGDGIGQVALKDLKYRQPFFFDFKTDKVTGELCELIQTDSSGANPVSIPREKMIHFVVNDDIDPFRGSSIYRPCYPVWWAKQTFLKLRNIQAERKAGKLSIKHEDPTQLSPDQFDTIAEAIADGYQNADMFKVGPGMSISVLQGEAEPQVYTDLITSCDRVLLRPTKIPWLLVQEGIESGSYALAEVQERVMFGGHSAVRDELESILNEPYGPIWWVMKLNNWSMSDMPRLTLTNAIEKDRVKRIELYNTSTQAGTLTPQPQDQNWLRTGIGLEEVEEQEVENVIATHSVATTPIATQQATTEQAQEAEDAGVTVVDPNAKTMQELALNGAQIASALSIIQGVGAKQIPYQSGIEMLVSFLLIDRQVAVNIMKPFIGFSPPQEPAQMKQQFAEDEPRKPSPQEARINFAQIEKSLDTQIEQGREDLSKEWSKAIAKAQLSVTKWVEQNPTATPKEILEHVKGLELDLDTFTSKLENGAKRAFLSGQKDAKRELGGHVK